MCPARSAASSHQTIVAGLIPLPVKENPERLLFVEPRA